MHLAASIFLPRMIHEVVSVSLQRPIATRGVRIKPTAHLDCQIGRLLHRGDREIPDRLHHDRTLAAHPRDDRRPVFVVMTPARLALLAAPTRPATQGLCPTLFGLPLQQCDRVYPLQRSLPIGAASHRTMRHSAATSTNDSWSGY